MENNASHYEPEHWELWYRASYPYLKNVPDSALFDRHETIATNLKLFWSEERQKISIRNVFSAWYWLRKEHQVRLEMNLRGLSPRLNIVLPIGEVTAPARSRRPNFGDVLFRFSKTEWLVRTLREGHLWINEGTTFLNPALGSARADDELKKTRNFLAERTRLTLRDGREIQAPSDVTWHVEGPPYFLFSTSSDFHPYLFDAFTGSDACLVIHDSIAFVDRIHAALAVAYPGWDFGEYPVHYFDPYEPASADEDLHPFTSKDFSYAFQMEWRFVCVPPRAHSNKHIELFLGPCNDLASLYPRA